jgi:isopentenyl-diphosphate delta-isomerase
MRAGTRCRGGVNHAPPKIAGRPPEAEAHLTDRRSAAATARQEIAAIDAQGRLFPIEKMEAHRLGRLHLAVSVFLFCGDEMLIQRRAAGKYHCGGLWANSCCTHPYWGETLQGAAQRRTFEELGVSVPLSAAGILTYFASVTRGLFEHERVQIFEGETDRAGSGLAPNSEEVMATRWISVPSLRREILASPQDFAPWLRIYMRNWGKLGLRHQAPLL